MGRINTGRVILGGLLAGLVINVSEALLNGVVFAEEMAAAMAAMNKPPIDNSMIPWFFVMGFALGITAVWVYAAIRPRLGPGVETAACAGATVWFLAYAYPTVGMGMMGLFPLRVLLIGVVWGLAELIVATIAGAWLYKEP